MGAELNELENSRGGRRCFNGAAPAWARNLQTTPPVKTATALLQRGRARVGAEFNPQPSTAQEAAWLQRGRARVGAEFKPGILIPAGTIVASTGPRPRGRGIPSHKSPARSKYSSLQRGRARVGAELGAANVLLTRIPVASTGPRPRGRGILAAASSLSSELSASTGPRPRGRGISRRWRRCAGCRRASTGPRPRGRGITRSMMKCFCFQTGASTGPRPRGRGIKGQANPIYSRSPCFNGAAPAWARNCRNKLFHSQRKRMLQRGRARVGAELSAIYMASKMDVLLQRGRARVGAEFGYNRTP